MEQLVFIALLLNALSVVLVLLLVYKGDKTLSEFRPYAKDIAKMRKELGEQANSIVAQARSVAEQIVFSAKNSSEKSLEMNNSVLKKLDEQLAQQLQNSVSENKQIVQNITAEALRDYQKHLQDMATDLTAYSKELKKKFFDQTNLELEQFSQAVKDQLVEISHEADRKITARLNESEADIARSKEEKLKQVDNHIYQILSEIAKKTIGRSIDMSEHEELVMEALEKAKKEKIF